MPEAERSDERLLEAYREGESGALAELIRRFHDDLMRFLIRLMGDRTLAEDVFQETFIQVHLSADSFDASRRFKPWLFTIAANKARDQLRKSARRRTVDLSAPIGGGKGGSNSGDGDGRTYIDLMEIDVPDPSDGIQAEERERMVQRAIDQLPHPLKEILLLAYFQRLSYSQIADSLEIPLGTVKSRLHAAVAGFAKHWQALNKGAVER
ncbi:MAG: sigma-70 family RNA polymerase sigma factor [Phycisphaerae bacterium]|nr:sigma-70 family RNA polymerase sigma factor [Phycisphaerae bacterium]